MYLMLSFLLQKGKKTQKKKTGKQNKGKKERKLEKFWVMEMDLSVPVKAMTVVIRVCRIATTKQK